MKVNSHYRSKNSNMGTCNGKNENFYIDNHNYLIPIEGYENMPLVSLEIAVEPFTFNTNLCLFSERKMSKSC